MLRLRGRGNSPYPASITERCDNRDYGAGFDSFGQGWEAAVLLHWLRLCCLRAVGPTGRQLEFTRLSIVRRPSPGDGSLAHPWNNLSLAQAHSFVAGDRIALKRGTVCHGSFSPQGSGTADHPNSPDPPTARARARASLPRPRTARCRGYSIRSTGRSTWLDLSGANTYGIFVERRPWHDAPYLSQESLRHHDVQGGAMKNKDNGLVVVGPEQRPRGLRRHPGGRRDRRAHQSVVGHPDRRRPVLLRAGRAC